MALSPKRQCWKCGELLFEARDDRMVSAPAIARENFIQQLTFTRAGNRPVRDTHTE